MVIVTLDVRYKPDQVDDARKMMSETLVETRRFPGCLGISVLVDETDETHHVLIERWESADRHQDYRAWRAGAGQQPGLAALMASAPVSTRFEVIEQ